MWDEEINVQYIDRVILILLEVVNAKTVVLVHAPRPHTYHRSELTWTAKSSLFDTKRRLPGHSTIYTS